ncbi:unnamed protein product [Linum tenue]|uniref:Uncharacterized protein n=1 Tax=Linum tenue TaxID=586396 RepID=A0AAV0S5U2_9ROSI|nr:unnamed protein product [Linum tenue]
MTIYGFFSCMHLTYCCVKSWRRLRFFLPPPPPQLRLRTSRMQEALTADFLIAVAVPGSTNMGLDMDSLGLLALRSEHVEEGVLRVA